MNDEELKKLLIDELDHLVSVLKADPDAAVAKIGRRQCEVAEKIVKAVKKIEPGAITLYAGVLIHATRSTLPGSNNPALNFAEFGQMLHLISKHLDLPEPAPPIVATDGSLVH